MVENCQQTKKGPDQKPEEAPRNIHVALPLRVYGVSILWALIQIQRRQAAPLGLQGPYIPFTFYIVLIYFLTVFITQNPVFGRKIKKRIGLKSFFSQSPGKTNTNKSEK